MENWSCLCNIGGLFFVWMETGNENRISTKDKEKGQVWDTVQCCLSLWVCSNLSMLIDKNHNNFWTRAQIFTRFWQHTAQTLYWQYRWCHHCVVMLMAPPWWPKINITVFQTYSQGPRNVVSKFHWIWPSGYGDTLHDRFLRDCFLQWPQNALLWSHPAMAAPDPADPIAALTAAPCKTPSEPAINLTRDPILRLEHHGAIWWFPAVSQISGKLVHPFRIFQWKQPQEPDLMWNPTQLDWNMCSISWATLATGNLTIGSWLTQLMRFQRRKSKLQPSWTTCPVWLITQCHNAAGSVNLKMFASDLESCQINSLTISMPLLTDATSPQMRKRNGTSSTDLSEPSMTRNLSRSCSHLTWWQPHLRCLKCAEHILPSQTTLRPWDWRNRRQSMP